MALHHESKEGRYYCAEYALTGYHKIKGSVRYADSPTWCCPFFPMRHSRSGTVRKEHREKALPLQGVKEFIWAGSESVIRRTGRIGTKNGWKELQR